MVTVEGITTIDNDILENMVVKSYFKNNQCLLGFKNPIRVLINSIPYTDVNGIHIEPSAGKFTPTVEISSKKNKITILLDSDPEKITITKVNYNSIAVDIKLI